MMFLLHISPKLLLWSCRGRMAEVILTATMLPIHGCFFEGERSPFITTLHFSEINPNEYFLKDKYLLPLITSHLNLFHFVLSEQKRASSGVPLYRLREGSDGLEIHDMTSQLIKLVMGLELQRTVVPIC